MKLCLGTFFRTFLLCKSNVNQPDVFQAFFKDLLFDGDFGNESMSRIMTGKNNAVRKKTRQDEMRRRIKKRGLLTVQAEMWKRVNVLIARPMFETFLYTLAYIVQADESISVHTSLNIGEEPIKTFGQLQIEDYGMYITSVFLYAALNTDNDEAGGVHEITPEFLTNCTEIMQKGTASSQRIEPANAQIPIISTWCPLKVRAQACIDKAYFQGRKELISEISSRLEKHKNSPLFLWGVGGIGKTALACHYAVYEATQYHVYFCTYKNSFKETIANLELFNPDGSPVSFQDAPLDERYDLHMQELRKCANNIILIIDNADTGIDLTLQDEYSELCRLDMQFIITTRNNMMGDGRALYVGEISENDCLNLIGLYYSSVDRYKDILRKMVHVLQRHTLAIELIAKSMEESCGMLTPPLILDSLKNASIDSMEWEPVFRAYGHDTNERKAIEHLSVVFSLSSISAEEIHLLGSMALAEREFHNDELYDYWRPEQVALIKLLHKRGWISKIRGDFALHPVIRCVILMAKRRYLSWAAQQEFIINCVVINTVTCMMNRNKWFSIRSRSSMVARNTLSFIDKETIPPVYRGLIICLYLFCAEAVELVADGEYASTLVAEALECYGKHDIFRFVIFHSAASFGVRWRLSSLTVTHHADVTDDQRTFITSYVKSYTLEAERILWDKRDDYTITQELRDVLARSIEAICRYEKEENLISLNVETQICLYKQLAFMHWLLGNTKTELKYAFKWDDINRNSLESSSYLACAEMHCLPIAEELAPELCDEAYGIMRSVITALEKKKIDTYRLLSVAYRQMALLCTALGKSEEVEEWREQEEITVCKAKAVTVMDPPLCGDFPSFCYN